jgi:putative transposase
MNDISIFFKELKGRFAQWYNRRHRRYGALWAERFKSLLLEGGRAVATVAAYIDLNPVRAALCADPKDYRYGSYAEALAKGCAAAYEGKLRQSVFGSNGILSGMHGSRGYRLGAESGKSSDIRCRTEVSRRLAHDVRQGVLARKVMESAVNLRAIRVAVQGYVLSAKH